MQIKEKISEMLHYAIAKQEFNKKEAVEIILLVLNSLVDTGTDYCFFRSIGLDVTKV